MWDKLKFKGKDLNELRKIRQYDEDFDPKLFAEEAQQIYIDSHIALMEYVHIYIFNFHWFCLQFDIKSLNSALLF